MTDDEIANYIAVGSRSAVCIFREKLSGLASFVMSYYITGKPGAYVISIEFDPVSSVDEGEGWCWHSESMELPLVTDVLEKHLKLPISKWENVTKSGRLLFCNNEVNGLFYAEQESIFKEKMLFGKTLLPEGVVWSYR